MFIIKGKYTIARIFLQNETDLEEATKEQITQLVNHPAFTRPISIMPDCHKGIGSVIGFTMPIGDLVVPNVIGVDIGCGVLSVNLGKVKNFDPETFDVIVKGNIPVGREVHKHKYSPNSTELYVGRSTDGKIKDICYKIQGEKMLSHTINSIGTLGGGNHFIEVGKDNKGNLWLTIHTGSRNFGKKVADYHQHKAIKLCAMMKVEVSKEMAYLPLEYGGEEYLQDMKVAQTYAFMNRKVIADVLIEKMQEVFDNVSDIERIESVHNYIDKYRMIRKGAISAHEGQEVVIPFNQEDGVIIAIGKGCVKMNQSAPHGAGRVLARGEAKRKLDLDLHLASMKEKGIYTSTLNENTLDECRGAYKSIDLIKDNIKDTCEILTTIKPIYNFKATE